jgi:Zn-dependent M16 (insulinase) family peptidase
LSVLLSILKESDTKNKNESEITYIEKTKTTGINFSIQTHDTKNNEPQSHLLISVSYREQDYNVVIELIHDFIINAVFDKKKIQDVLKRKISSLRNSFGTMSARDLLKKRLRAKILEHCINEDYAYGIAYLEELKEMKKNKLLQKEMKKVYKKSFLKNKVYIAHSSQNKRKSIIDDLGVSEKEFKNVKPTIFSKSNELVVTDTMSNYNGYGFIFNTPNNSKNKAILGVMATFLNSGYLWSAIRDKGGAYGGRVSSSDSNDITFQTWRDPRITESILDFQKSPDYLSKENFSKKDLHSSQISFFSKLDAPKTKNQLLFEELNSLITGQHKEESLRIRKSLKELSVDSTIRSMRVLMENSQDGIMISLVSKVTPKLKKNYEKIIKI